MYNIDTSNLLILNDLSIDREKYKKVIKSIPNSNWKIDNRGTVYDSRGNVATTDAIWDGSLRVRPMVNDSQQWLYVNVLVLNAFVGPAPTPRHSPWHRDNDRTNCSLDNLSWLLVRQQERVNEDMGTDL